MILKNIIYSTNGRKRCFQSKLNSYYIYNQYFIVCKRAQMVYPKKSFLQVL
jgi:hypothetical protein